MERRQIILGGIKHTGKTTVGRALAPLLTRDFHDLDEIMERAMNERGDGVRSLREWYRLLGEDGFRRLEETTLRAALWSCGDARIILAVGGGAPVNPYAGADAWDGCFKVELRQDPEVVYQRIIANGLPPVFGDKSFPQWYADRQAAYRGWADLILEIGPGESSEQAARRLAAELKGLGF